jgi:hypothetical protein
MGEKEISGANVGRGNTIRHPRTGEWVKVERVLQGESGQISTDPAKSHKTLTSHVTLEGGEQLDFTEHDVVVRQD